jgi:hypothetical protein
MGRRGEWTESTEWTLWMKWTAVGARAIADFTRLLAIDYWLCAKRSAHVRGGVGHGVRAAGLADMAVDPDALKEAEGEQD